MQEFFDVAVAPHCAMFGIFIHLLPLTARTPMTALSASLIYCSQERSC